MKLKGKNVVLGVTGGIAAYKACEIVSMLKKRGASIDVIMTRSATEFVTPYTFQSLTGNPVIVNMFESPKYWDMEHISLAQKSDLILVAPATANLIGKVANGIADDMLSTTIMASNRPVVFAPAMNTKMYENPVLQRNMRILGELGYHFVPPKGGILACGDEGQGKLQDVDCIVDKVEELLTSSHEEVEKDLQGLKFLITAGPTREIIDPVRFLSNHSTGKMGYEIARAAVKRGAKVVLLSGPSNLEVPDGVELIRVETAREMYAEALKMYDGIDVLVKTAAVSDYRPKEMAGKKMKKEDREEEIHLTLVRNPDILLELGKRKGPNTIHVGFAAETHNLLEYGKEKLKKKNLDFLVANDVTEEGAGFAHDTNKVYYLHKNGEVTSSEMMKKEVVAQEILDRIMIERKTRRI